MTQTIDPSGFLIVVDRALNERDPILGAWYSSQAIWFVSRLQDMSITYSSLERAPKIDDMISLERAQVSDYNTLSDTLDHELGNVFINPPYAASIVKSLSTGAWTSSTLDILGSSPERISPIKPSGRALAASLPSLCSSSFEKYNSLISLRNKITERQRVLGSPEFALYQSALAAVTSITGSSIDSALPVLPPPSVSLLKPDDPEKLDLSLRLTYLTARHLDNVEAADWQQHSTKGIVPAQIVDYARNWHGRNLRLAGLVSKASVSANGYEWLDTFRRAGFNEKAMNEIASGSKGNRDMLTWAHARGIALKSESIRAQSAAKVLEFGRSDPAFNRDLVEFNGYKEVHAALGMTSPSQTPPSRPRGRSR